MWGCRCVLKIQILILLYPILLHPERGLLDHMILLSLTLSLLPPTSPSLSLLSEPLFYTLAVPSSMSIPVLEKLSPNVLFLSELKLLHTLNFAVKR